MTATTRVPHCAIANSTRASVRRALGALACAYLVAGCNSLLDIHEPADQILQADAGSVARRDSGPRELDKTPPPVLAKDGGAEPNDPPPRTAVRDAGAPSAPVIDAGVEDSVYLWANWPMPNPVATSLPNAQGYAMLGSGHVADKVTHLEWQQVSDDQLRSWSDAVAYCESLTLHDASGWRLPARIELLSLVDFSHANPAIDPQTFSDAPADSFWSSSPFIGAPSSAWGVNFEFHNGFVFTADMKELHRVRCVR